MFIDSKGRHRLKISFDFDGTLTNPLFYTLAQHLIMRGHDVWILTARIGTYEKYVEYNTQTDIPPKFDIDVYNGDVIRVSEALGLGREKIIYTNLEEKSSYYTSHKFDLHVDDDYEWHCHGICENGGLGLHI